jgi:uncharacterized glyoxalase superfamily protein PhnB
MTKLFTRVSPVLGVQRVRQAAEYYRDILGFTLDPIDGVFQPPGTEPDGVYAIVKMGDAWIHLQNRREISMHSERPELERDVYLYVDNVAEVYANVERLGAIILQQPYDAPYGIREFVIQDLNGYRIVFGQPS